MPLYTEHCNWIIKKEEIYIYYQYRFLQQSVHKHGVLKSSVFWGITPCSSVNVNLRFGRIYRLHLQGRRASEARIQLKTGSKQSSCLAYSSTLKIEAIYLSEPCVDFQRITRRYISGDSTLHRHRCENLKSIVPFLI
jgi:hypothetical protein